MLRQTKYKIIIYALAGTVLIILLSFWIYFSSAQSRDYQRLSDLKVWQNVLSDYYFKNGTYVISGCEIGKLLSQCLGQTTGQPALSNLNDPINTGAYRYLVANLTDSDYEISFSLEAGIGGLPAGQYLLTKSGVKR